MKSIILWHLCLLSHLLNYTFFNFAAVDILFMSFICYSCAAVIMQIYGLESHGEMSAQPAGSVHGIHVSKVEYITLHHI